MSHENPSPQNPDLPILGKASRARELYAVWIGELERDQCITALLQELSGAVAASRQIMAQVGVVKACVQCDEDEGGSCCGAGIENRYTPFLLLINLLLGVNLPAQRISRDSCFFLGEMGCCLAARDVLCINYLCLKIQRMLSHEAMVTLQNTTGAEIDLLFKLHETIKKKVLC